MDGGDELIECRESVADRRRLMSAYAQQIEAAEAAARTALPVRPPRQPYMSYLCFDVEATCEGGKGFDYPNEIIVRPAICARIVCTVFPLLRFHLCVLS